MERCSQRLDSPASVEALRHKETNEAKQFSRYGRPDVLVLLNGSGTSKKTGMNGTHLSGDAVSFTVGDFFELVLGFGEQLVGFGTSFLALGSRLPGLNGFCTLAMAFSSSSYHFASLRGCSWREKRCQKRCKAFSV